MDKYKKLAMGVLKAVQKSSTNQLEKDLLGVVIKVESEKPQPGQPEQVAIGEPSIREAKPVAIEAAKPAELPATATAPDPEPIEAEQVIEAAPAAEALPAAVEPAPIEIQPVPVFQESEPAPEASSAPEEEKKPDQPS